MVKVDACLSVVDGNIVIRRALEDLSHTAAKRNMVREQCPNDEGAFYSRALYSREFINARLSNDHPQGAGQRFLGISKHPSIWL